MSVIDNARREAIDAVPDKAPAVVAPIIAANAAMKYVLDHILLELSTVEKPEDLEALKTKISSLSHELDPFGDDPFDERDYEEA